MRIVAGLAGGRRLQVPPQGTRPTSDRARQALFNSLTTLLDLDGARVLDLYAGTGAVGLEALSRGAASAQLVEADRRAAAVLARNATLVGLPGATIVQRPVSAFLAGPATEVDFVFADPPYALADNEVGGVLAALADRGWLAPGAVVVVERSARGGALPWPDAVRPVQQRRYGEGVLWYGRRP